MKDPSKAPHGRPRQGQAASRGRGGPHAGGTVAVDKPVPRAASGREPQVRTLAHAGERPHVQISLSLEAWALLLSNSRAAVGAVVLVIAGLAGLVALLIFR